MDHGQHTRTAGYFPDGNVKATIDDAKQAPGKGAGDSATGGGVGAGGIAIAINQA